VIARIAVQLLCAASLLAPALALAAAAPKPVPLPKPRTEGGLPLLSALKARASSRAFKPDPLPAQVLSDLLWAADGVNRPDGRRTAPSARNWQEVDVYVLKADGAFRYDAKDHALIPVAAKDLRALAGTQDFVATAPLNLVYVADAARMEGAGPEAVAQYGATDVGFVAQNVYLFAASERLAAVVRGSIDRDALAKALGLRKEQRVVLAQTVGFPAD
jgi:SagB-type dehydrogenase family enzyme